MFRSLGANTLSRNLVFTCRFELSRMASIQPSRLRRLIPIKQRHLWRWYSCERFCKQHEQRVEVAVNKLRNLFFLCAVFSASQILCAVFSASQILSNWALSAVQSWSTFESELLAVWSALLHCASFVHSLGIGMLALAMLC